MIVFEKISITKNAFQNQASTLSAITSDTTSSDEQDDDEKDIIVQSDDQGSDDNNDNDDEDDDEQDSNTAPICECGRELDSGWKCSHCRRQCSICNRSLSIDIEEYCERCFRLCTFHGLYSITFGSIECQQCNNN
ncbi:hypothetical protein INT46_005314 [Mucor plumbeus]|uniref:Uncharacterized protein n=1 Tax=Mucor plumbeus TaxID=97098 RepID=A0A8H7UW13_9FUNG|nr:hypothetical protein INT46_005314 [Mucor plumbeus]